MPIAKPPSTNPTHIGLPPTIEDAETGAAIIITIDSRLPANRPQSFTTLLEYQAVLGKPQTPADALSEAVRAYFDNGGQTLHVIRSGDTQDYRRALNRARRIKGLSSVLCPSLKWQVSDIALLKQVLTHCEQAADRMLLIDLPPQQHPLSSETLSALQLTDSSHGACYYPGLLASQSTRGSYAPVSIAAAAAGIWARSDRQSGAWDVPAGPSAAVHPGTGVAHSLNDDEKNLLNQVGVNPVVTLPTGEVVLWGARTLASNAAPQWRYLSVKRLELFMRSSIEHALPEWITTQENDALLWSALEAQLESFVDSLFRRGALQGFKAADAYFVRCGLGTTMSQKDIDRGRVIFEVGFAPLRPAEFVVLRIVNKAKG